ncbi:DUF378 domain-containing protein [Salirhabdus salicampi]|uniref:DUF378 domain-containing protein n=1 Tax=Salirhabdus salicampi TaxID=476102 RepID=UPI0020C4DDDA|nr:DUF378 domain-containing protein [Salirhabdus salicampi]MCP8617778.1 DUF378 domain-containing protein [Salirhabdus salicampi]
MFLTVIGAINWGLVGFFQFDLVALLLGGGNQSEVVPRIVYSLVGIYGIILVRTLFRND